jgi:dUTP pyrophosphatase|tara:strand:+ start:56 stop:511 length:456 start_codon:yes stop_codon:yes gene_type:complete
MDKLQIKVVNEKIGSEIPLPSFSTSGSAGMDLRACLDDQIRIGSGETELIPSGIAIYIEDPNYAGLILPRSGLGHKNGIVLGNLVGLIDSDYQGELMISLWNRSERAFVIAPGDRVAQLILIPVKQLPLIVVDEFDTSERGGKGFGSSGIN